MTAATMTASAPARSRGRLTAKGFRPAVEPKSGGKRGGLHIPFIQRKSQTLQPPRELPGSPGSTAQTSRPGS